MQDVFRKILNNIDNCQDNTVYLKEHQTSSGIILIKYLILFFYWNGILWE